MGHSGSAPTQLKPNLPTQNSKLKTCIRPLAQPADGLASALAEADRWGCGGCDWGGA